MSAVSAPGEFGSTIDRQSAEGAEARNQGRKLAIALLKACDCPPTHEEPISAANQYRVPPESLVGSFLRKLRALDDSYADAAFGEAMTDFLCSVASDGAAGAFADRLAAPSLPAVLEKHIARQVDVMRQSQNLVDAALRIMALDGMTDDKVDLEGVLIVARNMIAGVCTLLEIQNLPVSATVQS